MAFLDRLINVALPRVRDFRGISPYSFDGRGNYTLGLTEQLIFTEIQYDKIDKSAAWRISIVTTAEQMIKHASFCVSSACLSGRITNGVKV